MSVIEPDWQKLSHKLLKLETPRMRPAIKAGFTQIVETTIARMRQLVIVPEQESVVHSGTSIHATHFTMMQALAHRAISLNLKTIHNFTWMQIRNRSNVK